MTALDLLLSRKALAAGVGLSTRRNKILPVSAGDQPIPDRIGVGRPKLDTPAEEVIEDRTFVFSLFNGSVATIANRISGSPAMRIVRSNLAVSAATYCIGALNTFLSKWSDCWRIDANTFGVNGHVPPETVGVGIVPVHERSSLPYVVNDGSYYPTCIGDATRSTLFIGKAQETVNPRVLSISTTGTQKSIKNATNCSNTAYSAAGARLDAAGNFYFYGMNISHAANAVFYLYPGWSVINASRNAPYLNETAYGATITTQVRGNPYLAAYNGINHTLPNTHTSGAYSITPTLCPFFLGQTVTARRSPDPNPNFYMEWDYIRNTLFYLNSNDYIDGSLGSQSTTVVDNVVDASIQAYGYAGSDIEMAYSATLTTKYNSARRFAVRYYSYTSGGNEARFSGGSENVVDVDSDIRTQLKLGCKIPAIGVLSSIDCRVSGKYAYSEIYIPTVISIPNYNATGTLFQTFWNQTNLDVELAAQAAPDYGKTRNPAELSDPVAEKSSTRCITFSGQTRDFIYADIDEEIYIYLDAFLSLTRNETYDFNTLAWSSSDVYNLTLKYQLKIRGASHEFMVYNGASFTAPVVELASIFTGDTNVRPAENFHGQYNAGYKPLPVFTPPFMAQGNCPYIAYTTKNEEAAGSIAEFYLDMSIKILQYSTFTGSRYDGVVPVVPHQFLAMFRRYIGGESKSAYPTYPLTQNTTFWDTLFPAATTFRLQFANGVAGPWNTALGATFAANPSTEITRL